MTAQTIQPAPPPVPLQAPTATRPAKTYIRASSGWRAVNFKELWAYRELTWFLAMREVQVRYKQTLFGVLWAIVPPVMTMLVFNVLFTLMLGNERKPTLPGVPYAVSTFCALLPWQLFASSLGAAGNSLVGNQNLIRKVYFPRLVIPLAAVITALVDFAIAFAVLIALVAGYAIFGGFRPNLSWNLLALPLFILLAIAASLSLSLWLSVMNALYRDVKYTIPVVIELGKYVTPVIWTTAALSASDGVKTAIALNPMAGVCEGFRWCLLGHGDPPGLMILVSSAVVLALLVGGVFYFRRMERIFADLV